MSETRTVTQYPAGEPMVLTAPLNAPMSIAAIIANDVTVAGLQSQITALAARVTALENAASSTSAPA